MKDGDKVEIKCWADLIGLWGIHEFAEAIGRSYVSAQKMRFHNRVPDQYWDMVIEKAKIAGFSFVTRDFVWEVLKKNKGRDFIKNRNEKGEKEIEKINTSCAA
ncbi:MAG: hypothetical protein AAF228_03535 [Pseudomonadota bacterium]